MKQLFLPLFFVVFGAVCMAQIPVSVPSPNNKYLLSPGDELEGKVVGESQYDFATAIGEDGTIMVPFSETPVVAKCKSEDQLRTELKALLATYLKSPQLSLRVTDRKGRAPVTIYGEVHANQQIILTRQTRLAEIIAFSGGTTEEAAGLVQVFRTTAPACGATADDTNWTPISSDPTDVPSRLFSLSAVKQGSAEANPLIFPGDVIVVQKASPVYITGEVRQPQGLSLKEGGLTLTQAVAMIGGVNRDAKTKDIKIYRLKEGSKDREVISANYDLIKKGSQKDIDLKPYDIVEVAKTNGSIGRQILDYALGAAKGVVGSVSNGIGLRVLY